MIFRMFTRNFRVTVATNLPSLPMVIILPRALDDGYSLLGTGDIVFPGIFLCYLYRTDFQLKNKFRDGYFIRAWILYGVGTEISENFT